jgi:branched-chain amino acid transport system substrate-binding protein
MLALLALVVAMVAAVAACGGDEGTTDEGTAAADTSPIKITEFVSLTGVSAAPAENITKAVDLEVKAINDAGGINGRMIELEVVDDKSDVSPSVAGMTKAVATDVSAILGPFPQFVVPATRPIAEKAQIPNMAYAPPTMDDLAGTSGEWSYSFLCSAGPDAVADAEMKAIENQGWKTVLVIADQIPIHQESMMEMVKQAPEYGVNMVALSDSWALDEQDVGPIVNKIASGAKKENVDGLIILSNPIHVPAIQKGLAQLGIKAPVIGSAAGTSPAIFMQGPEAVEGFMAIGTGITNPASLPDDYPGKSEMTAFNDAYMAAYDAPADFYAGFGYDALHLVTNAMIAAGSADRAAVRDEIEATTGWQGMQGIFNYSPEDHVGIHGGFALWKVEGGQFTFIADLNGGQ